MVPPIYKETPGFPSIQVGKFSGLGYQSVGPMDPMDISVGPMDVSLVIKPIGWIQNILCHHFLWHIWMCLFWSCREIGGASVLATSIFQSWSIHVTWPWEIPRIHSIHMIICIDCYLYWKPSNHLRNLRSIHRISENFISHWPPLHPMILQNYGNLFMIVMANNYPLINVYIKLWKITILYG